MKAILPLITFFGLLLLTKEAAIGQPLQLTGPTCVIPGTVYLYTLSGSTDTSSQLQICVTGGMLYDSGRTCIGGNSLPIFKISWNQGEIKGKLNLTNGSVTASLDVNITQPLVGGLIDANLIQQIIDSAAIPTVITCSAARGGSCAPAYSYQWQQSEDNLAWTDLAAQTTVSLGFSQALPKVLFFRRMVVETGSSTVAYSNTAVVFLK